MSDYLKYNRYNYLNKDKKRHIGIYFSSLLFVVFIILFLVNYNTYNVYNTNAQTVCDTECRLVFYYPCAESFTYEFIKINGKEFAVEETFFDEVLLNSENIGMQNITLKVKEYKGNNNEFVKLQIYKNKETLFKKIIKIVKER